MQAPHTVFMVRPASFGFNEETAASNAFQNQEPISAAQQQEALAEFDRMVDLMRAHEIRVHVIQDTPEPRKPDAQFPNNWISTHHDGRIILYPMLAPNRRTERRADVVDWMKQEFVVQEVTDISAHEKTNQFLEGTGSIVFDYVNKIAYACRSPRTDDALFKKLCTQLGMKPILFDAVDDAGLPIYHTNVVMCVGTKFAVVCLDAIRNEEDQETVLQTFADTGHKVVAISMEQMKKFAGNMLEVQTQHGESVVLVSDQAFHALLPGQIDAITRFAEMIPIPVYTIEKFGGGSVRCMVAGIFLPRK